VSPAKTAEPMEMLFGLWTRLGPRKHALDGGAHWRNLANTIEPSMCGCDAAFLSNYFDDLLFLVACSKLSWLLTAFDHAYKIAYCIICRTRCGILLAAK